jgi:SAM-dependent methyltransferase
VPEDYFGEHVAERFDQRYAHLADPAVVAPIVDFLADLGRGGAALELGIGTGRIALPLAQRGVRVHGIDLPEAMVARLRAKPGAKQIDVTVGDFTTTTVEGKFSVVYVVANTIMNLTTQDEQVACFQNAGAHLEPNGCFVIEVLVPRLQRLPPGETFNHSLWGPHTSASTSTTSLPRAWSRTTIGSTTAKSTSSRRHFATYGRRSST